MLGDCKGPIVFPPDHDLMGISATYAESGIGSLSMILYNKNLLTIGDKTQIEALKDEDSAVELTTWMFGSTTETEY